MRNQHRSLQYVACALLIVTVALVSIAVAADANVAGPWNIKVGGDAGAADQKIDLKQDGNKLSGTFKGPRQSGTVEGTINGNDIKFHVKAFVPIDYVGTVDGDSMKGTLSGRGKTGNWTATRGN